MAAFGSDVNNVNQQDALAQLIDILDLGDNGDLDLPEFKMGLNTIGINLSHDEALTLFQSIDTEG